MDLGLIGQNIIDGYEAGKANSAVFSDVQAKIADYTATYLDAHNEAMEIGRLLSESWKTNLADALTDGRLTEEAAAAVIKNPVLKAKKDLAKSTKDIQETLNTNAGLGLNAIEPEFNENQLDGIITGITQAEDVMLKSDDFYAQITNLFEGYVDDSVRENADFQYNAGLEPQIERYASGKCCKWCANLIGKYPYEQVSNRGNDVFRRHKNCHCVVLYNPRTGRYQNVHKYTTRRETDKDGKDITTKIRELYEAQELEIEKLEKASKEARKAAAATWLREHIKSLRK